MTTTMTRRRPAGHLPAKPPPIDSAWDASRLRAAWERANPVPTDVGAAIGVTTETLRRWRHGRFVPNAVEMRKLERALGVPLGSLLPPE